MNESTDVQREHVQAGRESDEHQRESGPTTADSANDPYCPRCSAVIGRHNAGGES